MEKLAERHETFYFSSLNERKELAKQVLDAFIKDEWSYRGDWVKKSCKLEKSDPERIEDIASYNRFLMGINIKKWLNIFINGKLTNQTTKKIDDTCSLFGPFIDDNMTFNLFCDASIPDEESQVYKERCKEGTVSVVLGAGNANFLSIIDVFERVFIHSECVLLKHHPLRPFLYEPYACILEPLISENIVHMIYDTYNKAELLRNSKVNHIHFTGSEETYQYISNTLIDEDTKITGELGCATPWIILPGKWTEKEIDNATTQIVIAKITNGGAFCMSPQAILIPDNWEQKAEFYLALHDKIRQKKPAACYYPGAIRRKNLFENHYGKYSEKYSATFPGLMNQGSNQDDMVMLVDLGIVNREYEYDDYSLKNEAFCPVLVCGFIEYNRNIDDYIKEVCNFSNSKKLCGSLSCTVLTPKSLPCKYVNECVRRLNYGTIAINIWSVSGYGAALSGGTWGAHYTDRRSGRGRIGNVYRIKNVTKTIISGQRLEKPTIYMYDLPPKLIMDYIYLITVLCSSFSEKVLNTFHFLIYRFLSNIFGKKPQYGSVM